MSTAETVAANPSAARSLARKAARAIGLVTCGVLIVFLVLEGMSLLAAQRTESQRRQIGIAGGQCEFEKRVPGWLRRIAGDDVHSFMDYPVIVGISMTGSRIGNDNLARLPALSSLRTLDLHDSRVNSEGLSHVLKWSELRAIDLGNTPVTNITVLEGLPHLESLQLNFSQVRREYLAGLPKLKNLSILGAGYIQVTDQDVLEVVKCPNLIELNISGCDLSEQGLQPLLALEQLGKLVLIKGQYSAADLEAFQKARPSVIIIK